MTTRIRATLITISCILVTYILVGGLLGKNDSSSEKTYRDLGVYSEVLSRIKQDYVVDPNLKRVTDGAIRGLLEALDPYSTYLTPEEYQDYVQHPDPGPANIGIFISKRGLGTVISVLPGSPAEKAGIKAGDLFDRIDNNSVRDLSVIQLQRLLAGAPATTVTLSIVRDPRNEPQKIAVTRAILTYPPVIAKMVDDGGGYLRVATFEKGKAAEIADKLHGLEGKGASKIILDLRNCAGGEFPEAVDTASLFLDKGLISYLSGQRFPRQDFTARPQGPTNKLPLAILINQSTAGPAEVVAAAILGNKRGEVVGVRSFGVGVFQKPILVGDGSALLLSVAKYYTPDGKAINENGVVPSVIQAASPETPGAEEENEPVEPEHFGGKDDLQLQKAIEILNQSSASAKAAG
jgi:carboxyl-terminal processing protease